MKSSLAAYYETLAQPIPTLLVQQEIDRVEIAIANAIRARSYEIVHNAKILGNPIIANASGEIEPGVLNVSQLDFFKIMTAAGYEITRDSLTGFWGISWERGNSTVPPDMSAAREAIGVGGSFTTGDVKFTYKVVADPTWIMINDGSIGAPGSGATRSNEDTKPLYKLMYDSIPNEWAPVAGGRGESADQDFAAKKTLTLPKALGRVFALAGSGTGLSVRALGEFLGEEDHVLTVDELAEHTHPVPDRLLAGPNIRGGEGAYLDFIMENNALSGPTGSNDPHNNMQPTTFINAMVKL